MSLILTENAIQAAKEGSLTPNIVLEIEGVSTLFGTVAISKYLQYGDPINYGENYEYGGLVPIEDQKPYISFSSGTSTSIKQSLNVDRGTGESISSISVALIDKNEEMTQLMTPENTVPELLGRKCKLWMGFESTAWRDDYITIFRGNINTIESKPGIVILKILHPDNKKNSTLFAKAETEVTDTSINFAPADVDTVNDLITINSHGLGEGDKVKFSSTGTKPAGLSDGVVVSPTTNNFKVAQFVGGTFYNITTQGTGVHTLTYGISINGVTSFNALDTTDFFAKVLGPDGLFDPSISFYIRVNDEIMKYETKSGTQFNTLTRGALDTVAANHDSGDTVESFVRLVGNPIELALRLMLSGKNGPYQETVSVTHFGRISALELITDVIFFKDTDIVTSYNVIVGDFITTTGAANGANNVSLKAITDITKTSDGSYITVTGAGFVDEPDSVATIDFRSKYDSLGEGLKMHNDEVDIAEHVSINNRFTSGFDMDLYVKDTLDDMKAFISEQLYNPIGCYSLPRKAQSSIGIHNPPLPDATIKILSDDNVENPSTIKIERSLTKNFFNSVLYKFDQRSLDDKFLGGLTTIDGDSLTRFGDNVGNKPLIIEATGLRGGTAKNIANVATTRRLKKYKFGAEFIREMKLSFSDGFNLEVGDIILLEMDNIKISDIQSGTRSGAARLWEVENKTLNMKNGNISLSLTDTSFDKDARFALMSPSSFVKSGVDGKTFVIEQSYSGAFGVNEFKKYDNLEDIAVKVRTPDFVTVGTSVIESFNGNTVNLVTDLGFTPTAGMIMEFDSYDNQTDTIKLIYGFMSDGVNDFSDGGIFYQMF